MWLGLEGWFGAGLEEVSADLVGDVEFVRAEEFAEVAEGVGLGWSWG